MRMTGIGLIAAAALAGSIGVAVAQTSTTTTSRSAASPGTVKCWDSATKQVRNAIRSRSYGVRECATIAFDFPNIFSSCSRVAGHHTNVHHHPTRSPIGERVIC